MPETVVVTTTIGTVDLTQTCNCSPNCPQCCGQGTCCCPGVYVPNTLFATLTNQINCACATNPSITLTWVPANSDWEGSGPFCSTTVTIKLRCRAGTCDWVTNVSFANNCLAAADHTAGATNCNPFNISFTLAGMDTCCGGVVSSVLVTITQ